SSPSRASGGSRWALCSPRTCRWCREQCSSRPSPRSRETSGQTSCTRSSIHESGWADMSDSPATMSAPAAVSPNARRGWVARGWRLARQHKIGAAALGGVIVICLLAATAPWIAPYDPLARDYDSLLQPPSLEHPFGTDRIGRDILTRVIYGTQISVMVGIVAVGIAIAIGVPLGLVSGFMGGVVDNVIMRFMDALLAFPRLILALAIVAVLSPGALNVMIAVGVGSMPVYARLMRSQALSIR